ncbi:MAG: dihydropteroate synthase [Ignavibacteriae bacterium]|nr:dihydropteroate synthase [Ignavibacteriota bacterium]
MTGPSSIVLGGRTFPLIKTYVMGIVNVTPDSFSDGGLYAETGEAVAHALRLVDEGADILDIGGESTRPRGQAYGEGSQPVSTLEEIRRVIPVIEALAQQTDVPLSVDTTKSEVAEAALQAGATIVNDISGFTLDPTLPHVIARAGAAAVVMHMRGTPRTMQQDTHYDDLFGEVLGSLRRSVEAGRAAGIDRIMVDPGIGFGKDARGSLTLLGGIDRFHEFGCPVLVGPSRKAFIGTILGTSVGDRVEGTIAACVLAAARGARFFRVHDVRAVRRALSVADAILTSRE